MSRVVCSIATQGVRWVSLAAIALSACSKAQSSTATPAAGAAAAPAAGMDADAGVIQEAAPADDGFDGLHAKLATLEDGLRDVGVRVVGWEPSDATPAGEDPGRCTRVCELKEAICELEAHICNLAETHTGQARYAEACARVQTDCAWATEACDACSPT